ncbi:hypothetical protein MUK42_29256 [Musa troglodytarum]|uniref:Methyltransferase PMT27 n=1 Tax=Musa troglodytarum TaxID=320322 RepID=A0A9E7FJS9_9LILI|nr:hypothetical protein MUK42_29256 [Musa troglodytarum]
MAGFGKSSRAGKRHAASSMSSFSYYVTIVVFVAFCILGVWMLSSSSVIPPQATTDTSSRISSSSYLSASKSGASRIVAFRDPPLDAEEDAIKGDDGGEDENRSGSKISSLGESRDTSSNPENQIDSASSRRENENRSGSEEESKGRQELERPQEAEKNQNGGNEENQEQPVRENKEEGEKGNRGGDQRLAGRDLDGGTEDSKRLSEEEIHEQEQREHDEQLPSGEGEENQQETQQPQQTGSDSQEEQIHEEQQREHDEQLPNHEGEENQREPEQQQQQTGSDSQEEQTHEEQQREHDEQLPGGEGEQNQQESQQLQQTEGDSQGNQQESQPEIDQVEEKIQQVTNENQPQREESVDESQTQSDEKAEEGSNESQQQEETGGGGDDQQQPQSERQMEEEITNNPEQEGNRQQSEEKLNDPNAGESLTERAQSDASKDSGGDRKMPWATQADHSDNEKERRREETLSEGSDLEGNAGNSLGQEWKLCNVTAGPDYIPCLDNEKAIKQLHSFRHFEHRERHCPEEGPACLVLLPDGYKRSIEWPKSRDRIWYSNVPRTKLAEVKGHQNWVKVTGEYLTFPGGGTQFIHGALHYIDFIQQSVRDITWGKHSRVVLDVGCGVASFGGYLFERDVLTMSFAPKDEHEAQVQFALERGIPAISAVMGSQRLPFPSMVFDVVHCARCRVPWHAEGGTLLLELNRVLRPGGYFVWSATPVYQKLKEDVDIWKAMKSLTISMCWDLVAVKKDKLNSVAAAFYRKPISNECYDNRKRHSPPMCKDEDDPNAAWYIPLKPCMHRVPVDGSERASRWPKEWPHRLQVPPYWLNSSQMGIYGKPAPVDFTSDYEHWKRVVAKSYLTGFGIRWSNVRNVMDMRAVYGGFAAALKDLKVWVMNVVNIDDPDTLPIIYERGLFGIYHDWCESFSTYPRSYDLLHADRLFSQIKQRCKILPLIAEVDRIVRPGGKIIVRDDSVTTSEVEILLKSLHWEVRLTFSKDQEGILCAEKSEWRPEKLADSA